VGTASRSEKEKSWLSRGQTTGVVFAAPVGNILVTGVAVRTLRGPNVDAGGWLSKNRKYKGLQREFNVTTL
jgi:hypothetical protein